MDERRAVEEQAGQGHVFVVHGRIELLRAQAAVVPTGPDLDVSATWRPLVGAHVERLDPPPGWVRGSVRWVRRDERLWFLDVARREGADLAWLLDGVRGVLTEVAQQVLPSPSRLLPLVVLPVVGIGAGGFGDDRGAVVAGLLDVAAEVVAEHPVDIAFVTPDPAVHGAVQHLRRRQQRWPLPPDLLEAATGLAARARAGELALFFGAGVSIPAGLPSWPELLRACLADVAAAEGEDADLPAATLEGLAPLDQGELLRRVLGDRFGQVVADRSRAEHHALGHALLVALGCTEAATTNYDPCFELAAGAASVPLAVMPWQSPRGRERWLLKLNGDVEHPGSIVLARRDFVRYDALARPMASVLEAMMLTRHLLVVGASLTDDTVLRLTHEVAQFRGEHGGGGEPFGTVLDVEAPGPRRRLWSGELDWVAMPGDDLGHRARALDVFLDVLVALTTADASWVLDERFEALLDDGDTTTARRARELAADLAPREPWRALAADLDHHGARSARRGEHHPVRRAGA